MTNKSKTEASPGYDVLIRDKLTGEERLWHCNADWTSDFIWTEGNFACDCNRDLFFSRAAGIEPEQDHPCGDTHYAVLWARLPDGQKHVIDGDR